MSRPESTKADGGVRQRADVMSGGSYESANDLRLHFGLGGSSAVTDVKIHWAGGSVEHIKLAITDRIFRIKQGMGVVTSVYDSLAKADQIVRADAT